MKCQSQYSTGKQRVAYGRVLKFVLVIQAIEEYLSILGCHLPQP
jgi:hypothetical protein